MGWQLSKVSGCRDSCVAARALTAPHRASASHAQEGYAVSIRGKRIYCCERAFTSIAYTKGVQGFALTIIFQPLYRSYCSPKAPALPVQRLCNRLIGINHFRAPAQWGCSAIKLRGRLSHSLHKERPFVLAVSEINRSVILEPSSPHPPASEKEKFMAQGEWVSLNVSAAELQLCFTLPTGQSFRWRETAACEYTGVIGTRVVSRAPY